jgi:hypothetical protein
MKLNLIILLLISTFLFTNCAKDSNETCGIEIYKGNEIQKYKILFIGNSLTIYNFMPETVGEIAKLNGDSIYIENRANFGWGLKDHCNSPGTLAAIKSKKWDYVVIQGTGAGSNLKPSDMADTAFFRSAFFLSNKINENCESTRIISYMTFASKYGAMTFNDTVSCQEDPMVCNFEGSQQRIKENNITLSKLFDAEIAPAGIMWEILIKENPNFELYDADKMHPSPLGSYASSLAIYAVICKKSVIGAYFPKTIEKEDAIIVQNTINNSLFNCNPVWIDY